MQKYFKSQYKSIFIRSQEDAVNAHLVVIVALVSGLVALVTVVLAKNRYLVSFSYAQYDDSYVTYRYAANLLQGNGLRFNPGDNTNSASSMLYVVLLAVLQWITRIGIPQISTLLNLFGVFLLGYSTARILALGKSRLVFVCSSMIFAIAIGSFGFFDYWAFSGMETVFFLGILALTITTAIQFAGELLSTRRFHLFIGLLISLSLLRVEGAIAGSTLGFCVAGIYIATDRVTAKANWKRLAWMVLAPLFTFGIVLLFYQLYYGSPISDPIKFKPIVQYYERPRSEASASVKNFMFNISKPWSILAIFVCVVVVVVMILRRNRVLLVNLIPLAVLAPLVLFTLSSPYSDEYRYELILLIPTIALCALLPSVLDSIGSCRSLIKYGILALLLVFGVNSFRSGQDMLRQISARTSTYQYVQVAREVAGRWMESNTPPGSRVVSSDIGALSFFNLSNVYFDVAGLVNRDQLEVVRNGEDVYKSMRKLSPQFLVDTVTLDGLTGVEQILSNPQSYYIAATRTHSSCPSLPIFSKSKLRLLPENPSSNLQIEISRIDWDRCGP